MGYVFLIMVLFILMYLCYKVVFTNNDKINIVIWIVDLLLLGYLVRNVSIGEFRGNIENLVFYLINVWLGFLAILVFSFLLKEIVFYFKDKQNRGRRNIKGVLINFLIAVVVIFLYFAMTYRIKNYVPVVDDVVASII